MSAAGSLLQPHQLASLIATHSYEKHVLVERRFEGRDGEKYGPELNIKTSQDYEAHVLNTLLDPATKCFQGVNQRDIYFNEKSNTIIIVNNAMPEVSTCFRDRRHEREFLKQISIDGSAREALGLEPPEVREGGYHALHSWKERVQQGMELDEARTLDSAARDHGKDDDEIGRDR